MTDWNVIEGDCVEQMAGMPACSVDAVVCDPPYGLEFMGKKWDAFRLDDPGTTRHRGERVGSHGATIGTVDEALPSRPSGVLFDHSKRPARGVGYGGTQRAKTNRCVDCGKRDQFRNAHEPCGAGTWRTELIDPHAAPPTMLAFQEWTRIWALEALRVLKPGGHLLAFGGTRTYHRLACAIEDAGFEIRDTICWMYGSGFPKSLDVSKAIDKAAGAEREVVGTYVMPADSTAPGFAASGHAGYDGGHGADRTITAPATSDAERWEGWGTALKPAHEPIVVARKPLSGTVAQTVLEHGTGALNIDATRIGAGGQLKWSEPRDMGYHGGTDSDAEPTSNGLGRWPANVVLAHTDMCRPVGTRKVKTGTHVGRNREPEAESGSYGGGYRKDTRDIGHADVDGTETVTAWECSPECPVRLLDEQTGERPGNASKDQRSPEVNHVYGQMTRSMAGMGRADSGGASRFFYCAKTSSAERNAGLDNPGALFEHGDTLRKIENKVGTEGVVGGALRNSHPT